MKVGMIGLGKLGLPVATTMAARGLEVWGYDPLVSSFPDDPSYEEGFAEKIEQAEDRFHFADLDEVVVNADVLFCAVATPHQPEYEGITPIPETRADFDYTHLIAAVKQIVESAERQERDVTLSVISTVLPGTMAREVVPLLGERVSLAYNPSFIAMGTTIRDFLDPEFVLLGGMRGTTKRVREVYAAALGGQPRLFQTTIENAELIKVSYNTFIGLKLAFANTLMEVCHKTPGTDVDEVTAALSLAHRRLISPAYMSGGMGDGGGCHPRDNIALSWLARELDLSFDLFEAAMMQREKQAEWLADLMEDHAEGRRFLLLGTAYKPASHLETGSPALLVKDILEQRGHRVDAWDAWAGRGKQVAKLASSDLPFVALVGCKHPRFPTLPQGSVVIDPWRYMPDQPGVKVIRVGGYGSTEIESISGGAGVMHR